MNRNNSKQPRMPWEKNFIARREELLKASKLGKKIAILLYPDVDLGSSFRYRGYNVYQATKKSDTWQVIYFFPNEIKVISDLMPYASLLIFGRFTKWSIRFDELAYQARQQGIKIALDLDDCICGTSHIKEMFNVVSPDIIDQDYWISTCAHIELIAGLTDGFIVTNEYLGNTLLKSHPSYQYQVIRNFLNDEQLALSSELLENDPTSKRNKTFTIGYFSGSHTHATDFEVVYPELLELLKEHRDMKLKIVGLLKLPPSVDRYVKNGQIELTPMVDFLTLQKLISEVDLNIAPLADNVFANCKSELKFFEAAIVKVPTIASPTFAFRNTIRHEKTGFLCRPGEWHDTILRLYQDKELSHRIAENAYEYSMQNYTPKYCLSQIEKALDYYAK